MIVATSLKFKMEQQMITKQIVQRTISLFVNKKLVKQILVWNISKARKTPPRPPVTSETSLTSKTTFSYQGVLTKDNTTSHSVVITEANSLKSKIKSQLLVPVLQEYWL